MYLYIKRHTFPGLLMKS